MDKIIEVVSECPLASKWWLIIDAILVVVMCVLTLNM